MPPLPGLSALLRLADVEALPGSWWDVVARAHVPAARGLTPAALAAAALRLPEGTAVWLAQPVHLAAGADHLRLPAGGLLRLTPEEGAWLAADFAGLFGGDGLRLHPVGGSFVLTGLAAGAGPPDPAGHRGARVDTGDRGGPAALRRLASEIELWLYEHPLNLARQRRGALPVNALWLWGAGRAPGIPRAADAAAPVFRGEDARLVGLAVLAGGACEPPASDLPSVERSGATAAVIQLSAAQAPRAGEPPLVRIERDWIAPLQAAVDRGAIAEATLVIGEVYAVYRPRHRRRFWRRGRPWWEYPRR
jgi:hypothetical protein